MIRPYKSHLPTIDPSAFVDHSAQVIGDVVLGPESSIWMNCVVRGDVHRIRIGRRTNIQDLTMVHVMRDTHPTTIGDEVTIGHCVCLHGCTIEDRVLVGMGAVLLNGVHVGADSIIAAGSLLTEGTRIPPRSLVMGRPGTVKRFLTDEEVAEIRWYADNYVSYRLDYLAQGDNSWQAPEDMASTQPARGMRDFLPEDVRRRDYVIGVVSAVYAQYGFEPLQTPAVENLETLLGKYGEEGDRLIFKILKRGEEGQQTGAADLALRYDLTVPLARVVAEYRAKLPKFFKRYQIQPVWRADRPQRGRFREFYQCDVDAVGSTSMVVEAEILAAASDVLQRLGFHDFAIKLNHRQILRGVLDAAGVPASGHDTALVALDKLDKIGRDGVKGEFAARGLGEDAAERLLALFNRLGAATTSPAAAANAAALDELGTFIGDHPDGTRGVREVGEILALSASTTAGAHLRLDPSLARGLSYYTGAIMEIAVADLAGSLGGGGRYDNLVGMFSGDQVPACGFSLGLERILVVMGERGMFPPAVTATPADVLLSLWNADSRADALALARELRAAGLRVEVYPEPDKLGKQFRYASARTIPFVVVQGDDERARGEVAVKALGPGTQTAVARAEAGPWIRAALAAPRP